MILHQITFTFCLIAFAIAIVFWQIYRDRQYLYISAVAGLASTVIAATYYVESHIVGTVAIALRGLLWLLWFPIFYALYRFMRMKTPGK